MKRLLAMILAAVLLAGMIPFAGAAFTDADKVSDKQKAAVDYVSEKKVITGFPDGSFRPADNLTRAQAAKILCAAVEGADKAEALTKTDTGFADVPASHWAAKYVAYCSDKGIVAGVGGGKFAPDAPLTAVAFAKMLLVAYKQAETDKLVGNARMTNTRIAMNEKGFNVDVDSLADAATTRENACRLAYNFMLYDDILKTEPEAYKETKVEFKDGKNYRLLGRAMQTADGVMCDWSADGVEFTIDCKGTLFLTVDASIKCSTYLKYRVIVDGVPSDQVGYKTAGEATLLAMINVKPGVHTIRIIKDTQISTSADVLKSITMYCKPDTMQATQPKQKMMLVIGDSSSAGYGAIPTDKPTSTSNSSSIYHSYAYRVPDELGMDWEIVVRGSLGVIRQTGTPPYNYTEMYPYQNRWRDPDTKYSFPRKADLVLMKISGNDGRYSDEEYIAAMTDFIKTIRDFHGESVPVVLFGFNSLKKKPAAEKLTTLIPNCYGVFVDADGSGMGGHPSIEGQTRYTEAALKVVRPLVEGK